MLKIWLSTCPDDFADEYDQIEEMFHRGLSRLILYKRKASDYTYEKWILSLPEEFRDKVFVRGTPDLAEQLDVRGCVCDVRSLTGDVPESWKRTSCIALCHSLDELQNLPEWLSGAIFGPIFPSEFASEPLACLSKEYSMDELRKILEPVANKIPLIAWGGLDEDNVAQIKSLPLKGISVIGGIWNYADPINAFIKLSRVCASNNFESKSI